MQDDLANDIDEHLIHHSYETPRLSEILLEGNFRRHLDDPHTAQLPQYAEVISEFERICTRKKVYFRMYTTHKWFAEKPPKGQPNPRVWAASMEDTHECFSGEFPKAPFIQHAWAERVYTILGETGECLCCYSFFHAAF